MLSAIELKIEYSVCVAGGRRDWVEMGNVSEYINRWYRSTVEHCIGQLKNFKVLSSRYRGHLSSSSHGITRLTNAFKLISYIIALRIRYSRLWYHRSLLSQPNVDQVPWDDDD